MWGNPVLADLELQARAFDRRRDAERRRIHSLARAAQETSGSKGWLGRFVSSLSLGSDHAIPQTAPRNAAAPSRPC